MATGFMFACGLATTLGVAIRNKTAIRLESVYCALVVYEVKYVRLLATTLGVAIRCNTTIKLKSICCALMTCGQVFIYSSVTTQGIVVRYDTTIRLESVRYVLVVVKFLPICRARLR